MTECAAELDAVGVVYGQGDRQVRALNEVSCRFDPGTSTAILGRSGSGKSTLISVLSMLRQPTTGTVRLGGVDTSSLSPRAVAKQRSTGIGVVFQSFHLEPALTAEQNIMLPWTFGKSRQTRREAGERAAGLLEQLGIGELHGRRPTAMSGGQRQRVAIARALFVRPKLFIADEPTGNLDEETANEVAAVVMGLPAEHQTAVVVVTHDAAVADLADRRMTLVRGSLVTGNRVGA